MHQRFFRYDKNYLLRDAQETEREQLLLLLTAKARSAYEFHFNPLGLLDRTTLQIRQAQPDTRRLNVLYDTLAAIYRYKWGSNQLELLFDGLSHMERYQLDWSNYYEQECLKFCQDPQFVRLILGLTILSKARHPSLAEHRLRTFLHEHYGLKIHKKRGILEDSAWAV